MNTMNRIARECIAIARVHGFTPRDDIIDLDKEKWYLATKIALIHSEASEMLEALRLLDKEELAEEGIDVLIRTLEFLKCLGVDIDKEIKKKMEVNRNRTYMHGGKAF